jgi:hypothetical protein
MMSDASIADCLAKQWDPSLISYVFIIIDLTLTSSIAFNFAICGLVDLHILNENANLGKILAVSYTLICSAWYRISIPQLTHKRIYSIANKIAFAFVVLYIYLIYICCSIFMIAEAIYIYKNRSNKKALGTILNGSYD